MSKERPAERRLQPQGERDLTADNKLVGMQEDLTAENKPVIPRSGNQGDSSDNSAVPSQVDGTSGGSHANPTPSAETGGDSSANQTSEGK